MQQPLACTAGGCGGPAPGRAPRGRWLGSIMFIYRQTKKQMDAFFPDFEQWG